jgi:Xaa-Pro aminopeptidase
MRLFKSAEELEVMRRAGRSPRWPTRYGKMPSRDVRISAGRRDPSRIQPSRRALPSYNTIVGGGENGCILHYTENECELRDGDLVLIDAGCEYRGYAGDITRPFRLTANSARRSARFTISSLNLWKPR